LTLKDQVRAIKFKKQSNVLINESSLPNKSQLIKIVKEEFHLDYRLFKVDGIKSIKDRIILLIFVTSKILENCKIVIESRDILKK
jgi:hypothetical protein